MLPNFSLNLYPRRIPAPCVPYLETISSSCTSVLGLGLWFLLDRSTKWETE
uniref:Uncharacterized protein MANES_04G010200 n=1 Tax=Rhizophora mucronata TaxID=61149 RepID=A0A2P2NKT7_RHIMU